VFAKDSPHLKEFNHAVMMNGDFIRRTFRKYFTSGFRTYNSKGLSCEEQFLERPADMEEEEARFKPLGMFTSSSHHP